MGTGRIKKNTLRAKMLGILMLCAMTSLLAAGIVSYMALRMIQNDSIEDIYEDVSGSDHAEY